MIPDRTELEWTYEPADFFEVAYRNVQKEYELVIENGRVVATLASPQRPVPDNLHEQIKRCVDSIFLIRQLQVHRICTLQGPRVYQHMAGQINVDIRLGAALRVVASVGTPDIILRDQAGNIVRDTRAERIAADTGMLDSIAPKLARSPILHEMLMSYSRSISDPSNELVHLFETRDALRKHYGIIGAARTALNIGRNEWERFDTLANEEPFEQGRHRGRNIGGLRAASNDELKEARSIIRKWIIAFAQTV